MKKECNNEKFVFDTDDLKIERKNISQIKTVYNWD